MERSRARAAAAGGRRRARGGRPRRRGGRRRGRRARRAAQGRRRGAGGRRGGPRCAPRVLEGQGRARARGPLRRRRRRARSRPTGVLRGPQGGRAGRLAAGAARALGGQGTAEVPAGLRQVHRRVHLLLLVRRAQDPEPGGVARRASRAPPCEEARKAARPRPTRLRTEGRRAVILSSLESAEGSIARVSDAGEIEEVFDSRRTARGRSRRSTAQASWWTWRRGTIWFNGKRTSTVGRKSKPTGRWSTLPEPQRCPSTCMSTRVETSGAPSCSATRSCTDEREGEVNEYPIPYLVRPIAIVGYLT